MHVQSRAQVKNSYGFLQSEHIWVTGALSGNPASQKPLPPSLTGHRHPIF